MHSFQLAAREVDKYHWHVRNLVTLSYNEFNSDYHKWHKNTPALCCDIGTTPFLPTPTKFTKGKFRQTCVFVIKDHSMKTLESGYIAPCIIKLITRRRQGICWRS
jgi:hypothetical protein